MNTIASAKDYFSPKAILAFIYPAVATLLAVLVSWVVTGSLDDTELRTAIGGVLTSILSFVGAYVGKP